MAFVQVLNFRQPAWNLQDLLEQREREAGLILRVTALPRAERGSSEGFSAQGGDEYLSSLANPIVGSELGS